MNIAGGSVGTLVFLAAATGIAGCVDVGPVSWAVPVAPQAIALAKAACPHTAGNYPGFWQAHLDDTYWQLWHHDMVMGDQDVTIDAVSGGVRCPLDP